ncbi:hypothetical protein [Tautonia plasticadhaerens]|uniref:Cupin domain protein n=1 Tax=Tautonia plasticadhaerens TaxID=2527974 RepID=A0A518H0Y5_9BACT|nr:hypothetical protein [Tautonia plasticadhaerens]QDV34497.1 hypothetical protein ElP_23860 [Tautonia plasticadhaerens]
MTPDTNAGGIGENDAESIRVEPGSCSGPKPGPAVLLIVEGFGSALSGDVWVEVGPGDRVVVDAGETCAVRSPTGGGAVSARLVHPTAHPAVAA